MESAAQELNLSVLRRHSAVNGPAVEARLIQGSVFNGYKNIRDVQQQQLCRHELNFVWGYS